MTDETTIAPLVPRPEVLDFLLTRRSRPAKTLTDEAPPRELIETLLAAAARVPDHGKLQPWRFVIASGAARARVIAVARARTRALGMDDAAVEKAATGFGHGGVLVAVVSAPRASDKIPLWEQELSAGAVCLGLVNAALAAGWGANWLTGPLARDGTFLAEAFGCLEGESVAGFIHLGRETVVPADRPRPEIGEITTWL